jgi:hypothetical protein
MKNLAYALVFSDAEAVKRSSMQTMERDLCWSLILNKQGPWVVPLTAAPHLNAHVTIRETSNDTFE